MSLLQFQVVSIPGPNCDVSKHLFDLRQLIKACGVSVKNFSPVKIESEDHNYVREAEEFVVSVDGTLVIPKQSVVLSYQQLIKTWMQVTEKLPCNSHSVLSISDRRYFETYRISHHEVTCEEISFGTLPFPGSYFSYATLCKSEFSLHASFCHDVRTIEVSLSRNSSDYGSPLSNEVLDLLELLDLGGPSKDPVMVISYHSIQKILVKVGSQVEIFLDLSSPPLFYLVEKKRLRTGHPYRILHRVLTAVHVDVSIIGKANVICFQIVDVKEANEIISRLRFRCGQLPVHYINALKVEKGIPAFPHIPFSHFGCIYILTAIFNRSFCMVEQCLNVSQSVSVLNTYCYTDADCLEKALVDVLFCVDSGKMINFWRAVDALFQYYVQNKKKEKFEHYIIPEKSRLIRRIIITPTKVLMYPPEIMFENRVLRNFNPDYALRVNFRDDNISRLSWNAQYASSEIFECAIIKPMGKGLVIGFRHYKFLAWSNSQIRDHGVWMYAKDTFGNEACDIRKWMGDFSHIHTVSKYMARMGQCFSQTEDTVSVPLSPEHVRTEKDIERGLDSTGKKYCFSDGVGKISRKLASQVHTALNHAKHCCAFQIRYGGYKGMLVVDPTLTDVDIVFRESMKKFDSPQHIKLEIACTRAPVPVQLNRPIITILNQLGVNDRIFLQMQEDALRKLTDMLLDEEKACAFLRSKTPDVFKYKDISGSGVGLTTEPFFRSLLLALHRHHVDMIKTKANIPVDPMEGRNMLGVIDETGHLTYGQVFVQYTNNILLGETSVKDTTILKCPVVITKNPCMHPGDIRKFMAVDIPELHHIVDCVVFPQKGHRPHPNEMAGSDLDGDEYAVFWKKDFIFHQANYPPADYPSHSSHTVSEIQEIDMISFLCEYIKNDQVGVIANAHLALADEFGIKSDVCLKIAAKFSTAVDFAKNGVFASLGYGEKPQHFPDFMEKNFRQAHKSRRALGKLYRVCKDFETENELASSVFSAVQVDPALQYPGWEKYEKSAIESRNKYCRLLKSILQTYGIQHESEAFSGAFSRLHCRYLERKDRAEVEKVIIGSIKALCKNMKQEFLSEFGSAENIKAQHEYILQKASAWYMVTYRSRNAMFLSFPWIVSGFLANIRIRRLCEIRDFGSTVVPVVEHLNKAIEMSITEGIIPNLPYEAAEIFDSYYFLCDTVIVLKALRVMIAWAIEQTILQEYGKHQKAFLFLKTFVRLFMHVAEQGYYVSSTGTEKPSPIQYSPAALCLSFLRFCFTLRFYNKRKANELLPFPVFKYRKLSKIAMVTYYSIALWGKFHVLRKDTYKIEDENYEMKPLYIDSSLFGQTPVPAEKLQNAEQKLIHLTGVQEVRMREERGNKKVVVIAYGNEISMNELQYILRKDTELLNAIR